MHVDGAVPQLTVLIFAVERTSSAALKQRAYFRKRRHSGFAPEVHADEAVPKCSMLQDLRAQPQQCRVIWQQLEEVYSRLRSIAAGSIIPPVVWYPGCQNSTSEQSGFTAAYLQYMTILQ